MGSFAGCSKAHGIAQQGHTRANLLNRNRTTNTLWTLPIRNGRSDSPIRKISDRMTTKTLLLGTTWTRVNRASSHRSKTSLLTKLGRHWRLQATTLWVLIRTISRCMIFCTSEVEVCYQHKAPLVDGAMYMF